MTMPMTMTMPTHNSDSDATDLFRVEYVGNIPDSDLCKSELLAQCPTSEIIRRSNGGYLLNVPTDNIASIIFTERCGLSAIYKFNRSNIGMFREFLTNVYGIRDFLLNHEYEESELKQLRNMELELYGVGKSVVLYI
jgi:hypothetical protein